MLEKAFFDRMGISNQVFTLRQENLNDSSYNPRMHCFLLFYDQGKCYHFEHSNSEEAGIYSYDKEEDALDQIIRYYQKQDNGGTRRLDRFDTIPLGLTFAQLNQYFDTISKTTAC